MNAGTRIDESGTLLFERGRVYMRRDMGGRFLLDLRRQAIDEIELRVRVIGTYVGYELVDVDAVALI